MAKAVTLSSAGGRPRIQVPPTPKHGVRHCYSLPASQTSHHRRPCRVQLRLPLGRGSRSDPALRIWAPAWKVLSDSGFSGPTHSFHHRTPTGLLHRAGRCSRHGEQWRKRPCPGKACVLLGGPDTRRGGRSEVGGWAKGPAFGLPGKQWGRWMRGGVRKHLPSRTSEQRLKEVGMGNSSQGTAGQVQRPGEDAARGGRVPAGTGAGRLAGAQGRSSRHRCRSWCCRDPAWEALGRG